MSGYENSLVNALVYLLVLKLKNWILTLYDRLALCVRGEVLGIYSALILLPQKWLHSLYRLKKGSTVIVFERENSGGAFSADMKATTELALRSAGAVTGDANDFAPVGTIFSCGTRSHAVFSSRNMTAGSISHVWGKAGNAGAFASGAAIHLTVFTITINM